LDEDGFLDNADDWNEEVANVLAATEEVSLRPNIGISSTIFAVITPSLV
jgi:sulfur relay (sulfurtransferase) DsrC/TusE family protein